MNEGLYEDSRNWKLVLSVSLLSMLKAVTDMQLWVPGFLHRHLNDILCALVFTTTPYLINNNHFIFTLLKKLRQDTV